MVNCLWLRCLMHLDILFFLVHWAFLSSTFGSSTGEYSDSSCSSLSADDFVSFSTGLMFAFKHFSSMASPTCVSVPSRLWELEPSRNKLKPSSKDEEWLIGGCAWIYYTFLNALDIGILVSLLCYILWMVHYMLSFVH